MNHPAFDPRAASSTQPTTSAKGIIAHAPGVRGDRSIAVSLIVDANNISTVLDVAFTADENAGLASLAALEHTAHYAARNALYVELHIAHSQLHQWFTRQPSWHLTSKFHYGADGDALRSYALKLLGEHIHSLAADKPPLTIATDASARAGHTGVGIAYVTDTGHARQDYLGNLCSVTAGELEAIKMALTYQRAAKVQVLTDSRNAVQWITGEAASAPRERRRVAEIRDLTRGREVTFRWIRSHSGHPLNEIADRLAVAARRNADAGVTEDVRRRITHDIVSDLATEAA